MTANNSNHSLDDAKEKVRAFVLEYAADRGVTAVKDDEPLLTTNIIDSLGSFRMIAFLEETFPLTIEDTDMVPENFQTLNDVEIFIANKLEHGVSGSSDAAPIAALEIPELVNA
jgi:acyl carrier protein